MADPTQPDYIEILNNQFAQPAHLQVRKAAAAQGVNLPNNFCSAWPIIKPILQTVAGTISWIPQWGPTAATVLGGLINVGQSIYDTSCSTSP